jgi:DNA polymerase I
VKEIIIDIETDGLQPTQIWCCGVKVVGEPSGLLLRTSEDLQAFLDSNEGAVVYAHNGDRYDYPALEGLWGIDFSRVVLQDTVKMARAASPKRIGGNSLKNLGELVGMPKSSFDDFSEYTEAMGIYCLRDLDVTEAVLVMVKKELEEPSAKLEAQVRKIIDEQVAHGWLLDLKKCFDLLGDLREKKHELEEAVRQRFTPRAKFEKLVTPKVTKDGKFSRVGLGDLSGYVAGDFSRISFPTFNLGSRKQIGEYLSFFGWVPTVFTPTGQPIVDEGTLEGVDIPEAQLIAEYLMLEKRIAMVASWVDAADEHDRVHGQVDTVGAVTFRMTHSNPNMAQVTASGKPYGKEMRQCWIVPKGYRLVGTDADGLELRMLAHYMNDQEYIEAVSKGRKEDGSDIHSRNKRAAGLLDRDTAKSFIYAFLYGAGDSKIGSIAGLSRQGGRDLKAKFLKGTPALKQLIDRVSTASRRGWLKGLDGRRIKVRSEHAALNSLLQSAGAIVMKRALVILYEDAKSVGLDFQAIGNIHDEIQCEVREDHAEQFAVIASVAIRKAGEYYNLRCPLSGTSKIGNNWQETH